MLTLAIGDIVSASNAAGVWKGTWNTLPSVQGVQVGSSRMYRPARTNKRQHHGTLRVRLRPEETGGYQGLFTGRFAKVVPYIYRAQVVQRGNQLVASRRLGPFGEYRMQLRPQGNHMVGVWSAGGETGTIQLSRSR